ncbi:MAG: class probable F420-dependent enzyme [Verrucomicrobiaceae bacterium]|nr:class probable F420-dependent enzyme [Verrucomicrobiaceae bacterium]MDB6120508.1 class probable F420-dependent enzyme [Verrucomicrobiaceae bacterium]
MIDSPSPSEQREHVYKLLKEFGTAMLVTHGDEDHLRVRPMAIAQVEDSGDVWFITSSETAKAHEIEHDSRVHLVCQKDHGAYLSIGGRGRLVNDRTKLDQVWNETMKVWFPGGKEDPTIALIAVTPEVGEFWDNEGVHMFKYMFESAKAYLTGTTPDLEEGSEHGITKL